MTMDINSFVDNWTVAATYADEQAAKAAWAKIVLVGIPCAVAQGPVPDGQFMVNVPSDMVDDAMCALIPFSGSENDLANAALREPFQDK